MISDDTRCADFSSVADVSERLRSQGYIASPQIATSVLLAERLHKPLLIEGPAGCGKTELAKVLSQTLAPICFGSSATKVSTKPRRCTSGRIPSSFCTRRFCATKLATCCPVWARSPTLWPRLPATRMRFFRTLLLERPLLKALRAKRRVVLLIDEVDRAEAEFEAFLLEVLSDFQVSIPELGTLSARHMPLVILTSNNTREMTDALRRRCLYLHIGFPDAARELQIVHSRLPQAPSQLVADVVRVVQALRTLDLKKSQHCRNDRVGAGTLVLGQTHLEPQLAEETLNLVLKYQGDLDTAREQKDAVPRRQTLIVPYNCEHASCRSLAALRRGGRPVVIAAYYNPHGYRTRAHNYALFADSLRRSHIPLLTVGARLAQSRLCCPMGRMCSSCAATRCCGKRTAAQCRRREAAANLYQSVAWLDADILFERADWATQTSLCSTKSRLCRCFRRWFGCRAAPRRFLRYPTGIARAYRELCFRVWPRSIAAPGGHYHEHGHTGFGWAARRDLLCAGTLRYRAIGERRSPDCACRGRRSRVEVHRQSAEQKYLHREHFRRYCDRFCPEPRSACGGARDDLHLWHGDHEYRRYSDRNIELVKLGFDPVRDLRLANSGAWEWGSKHPELHAWAKRIFRPQKEDGDE